MTRELTCIVCPRGCTLTAVTENGKVVSVSGNACPRGARYAADECTHPVRTVTTTAKAADGTPVPVRTSLPVPKEKMVEVVRAVSALTVTLPVHIGDVLAKNVLGTGADIVVTAERG